MNVSTIATEVHVSTYPLELSRNLWQTLSVDQFSHMKVLACMLLSECT